MKKIRKILFSILIFVIIFLIYKKGNSNQIIYVALGDSLAQGTTPYGNISYSYVDYLADYLKENHTLKYYTKAYTQNGYKTTNIINQINNNTAIKTENKTTYIKELLRSSDLVTISIGFDDFHETLNQITPDNNLYQKINNTSLEISNMLKLVKKYAKGTIILVGYYNPLANKIDNSHKINKYITYSDKVLQKICKDNGIQFVKISDIFSQNTDYLPNPLDIHPNNKGYIAISNKIIKVMEKKAVIDL